MLNIETGSRDVVADQARPRENAMRATGYDLDERLKQSCNFDMGDSEIDEAYRTFRGIVFGVLFGSLIWAGIALAAWGVWQWVTG